jgi:phenylacetate-CoA ligase
MALLDSAQAFLGLLAASRARRREQWLPPDRLRELRDRRLARLIRAAAVTPHYRASFAEAGLDLRGPLDATVLERLPVLEKAMLRGEASSRLLTRPPADLFAVATSGSTGMPVRLVRTRQDQAQISAQWDRLFAAYGRKLRDRQVNIGSGRAVAKAGPAVTLRRWGLLPALHQVASFDPLEDQIRILRAVRPQMISAYTVGLELLAEAVLAAGVTDIRPRLIYTSGMGLSPRCRGLAKAAFGVEPFDVYATNEVGPIAWECPENRSALHLNDDIQIVEILDERDRPVPTGESGQLVVTQLLCTGQPLIRYRIGDLASRLPGRCGCGRGLALMRPVEGRSKHIIRSPDGRIINTITVSSILAGSEEVGRYQVWQTAPDVLRVLVIPTGAWREGAETAIQAAFTDRLGRAFRYEVERVEALPLTPAGKFQTIVPLEPGQPSPTSPPVP